MGPQTATLFSLRFQLRITIAAVLIARLARHNKPLGNRHSDRRNGTNGTGGASGGSLQVAATEAPVVMPLQPRRSAATLTIAARATGGDGGDGGTGGSGGGQDPVSGGDGGDAGPAGNATALAITTAGHRADAEATGGNGGDGGGGGAGNNAADGIGGFPTHGGNAHASASATNSLPGGTTTASVVADGGEGGNGSNFPAANGGDGGIASIDPVFASANNGITIVRRKRLRWIGRSRRQRRYRRHRRIGRISEYGGRLDYGPPGSYSGHNCRLGWFWWDGRYSRYRWHGYKLVDAHRHGRLLRSRQVICDRRAEALAAAGATPIAMSISRATGPSRSKPTRMAVTAAGAGASRDSPPRRPTPRLGPV